MIGNQLFYNNLCSLTCHKSQFIQYVDKKNVDLGLLFTELPIFAGL